MARLAPEERQIVLLSVLEGYTMREIAQMLSVKEGTVKTRLMRSRQRFKKIYLGQEGNCT